MSARSPIARSELPRRKRADDAGRGQAAMHLAAVFGELGRDQFGGALLLEADLRMGVDVAADPGQLG